MTDLAMLAMTRLLLRFCSPERTHRVTRAVGSLLPPLRGIEDIRAAMGSIGKRGSCLSRALAVAARAPEAVVAIGVEPRGRSDLFAHAWLEVAGRPIDPSDVAGGVIARLAHS